MATDEADIRMPRVDRPHPDGGQLFFPLDATPFVVPLALPGDDLKPEQFISFYFDGSCGLYINPDIWHEGVFPLAERGRFFDKQGKVHARISTDFPQEFGCLLSIPLRGANRLFIAHGTSLGRP